SLRPERRALGRMTPREEERARGGFPKARGEERRVAERSREERLELVRMKEQSIEIGRAIAGGDSKRDPVVAPDRVGFGRALFAEAREDRSGPRRVHARAERRQDADAMIADLVGEALDDDRPIARDLAHRVHLLA